MTGRLNPLRVGRIDYANAWPLFHYLEDSTEQAGIEIVLKVPAELNRLLREGEIQVAAVSSFAYGMNDKDYVLLPHLSVGSEGKVNSILLFLKQPIGQSAPERIAVTTTSATSVNLLKILMKKYYELDPVYEPAEPDLDRMLEWADGALLIGDPAIRESWENKGLTVIDLGEVWNQWTGLAMTYAVVAARKEAVERSPEAFERLFQAFTASKEKSAADLTPLIEKATKQLGGDPAYWQMYFTCLNYDFGPKQQEGLTLYFRYASELGLLDHDVNLHFYKEESLPNR
ncbi:MULTISPECIES: menaquinone biosynthesis protein [unclassified Paenibacillus]|uniref:menaquinone biosynthesis protein n=1 Tax=unclassified Paenibacillus TaxID=185978 RepID=UPI001045F8DB|nr:MULTISPECIES: menaquinone biosynthesis protein [unclassified Paenibacillus]NIK67717.1 chorismate dehydratase [Paenibacillus sp. BK720]TCN01758.1 futalosine synthase [Paenibacillus sp. BK033]